MRFRKSGPLLAGLMLAGAPPVLAQAAQPGAIPFERYRLDNGLEVILAPHGGVPVVAVDVWYHVGAANEQPGRTGFAHLFEHMMFQGSQNVGKGEHMSLVQRAGGSMNGTTGSDRTNYFETLPANRLNLGLWLEADRMRSLAVTEENLKNQIEVVKEEKRMRVDNAPYGAAFRSALAEITYDPQTCFAYGHEGIGSMEDLEAASVEDVREFFATYYAPNNATLAVVGDFDPAEARRLIQEYFGEIPRGPDAPPVRCEQPFSKLPLRTEVPDRNATLPALILTHGLPAATDPDVHAVRLLTTVLTGGESSRLNERLVRQEKAALQTFAFPDFRKGPGVLLIGAIPNQGVEVARLEALVEDELARVRREGITAQELEKAKNLHRFQTVQGLQTALGKAEALQQANAHHGDPAMVGTELERTMAVTLDDVRRVAERYLSPQNRATVVVQPATAGKE